MNSKTMTRKALTMNLVAFRTSQTTGKTVATSSISITTTVGLSMAKTILTKIRGTTSIKRRLLLLRIREEIRVITEETLKCQCQFNRGDKTSSNNTSRISRSTKNKENSRMLKGRVKANKSNLWERCNHNKTEVAALVKINQALSLIKSQKCGKVPGRNAWDQMTRLDATWIHWSRETSRTTWSKDKRDLSHLVSKETAIFRQASHSSRESRSMISKTRIHPVATLIRSLILKQHNSRRKVTKSPVLVIKSLGSLNRGALTKMLTKDFRKPNSIDRSSKVQMIQALTTLNKRWRKHSLRNSIAKDWRGLDLLNKIRLLPVKAIRKIKALVSQNWSHKSPQEIKARSDVSTGQNVISQLNSVSTITQLNSASSSRNALMVTNAFTSILIFPASMEMRALVWIARTNIVVTGEIC